MRAIMVMFDSLNRHFLPNYGCGWVKAPNFERLAEKTVTFCNNYVGSMPCMPARRELHTGRACFMHRSWGPMEPYDNSMPEILKMNGIHSHLSTDHSHYFEEGGSTYHERYRTWEYFRGQEGDSWKGFIGPVDMPEVPFYSEREPSAAHIDFVRQEYVNRQYLTGEALQPQSLTFDAGLHFIERNMDAQNWFLQIETFDPHEPFYAMQHYKDLYPDSYRGPAADWPPYAKVREDDELIRHVRHKYAALLSMCDKNLGRVLDMMDCNDMWKDTMLIVNTDHGYLLGEHGWWAKSVMPVYNEIAHTPLFVWDPRIGASARRCAALTQTVDLAPTLLEFFGVEIPKEMEGKPLRRVVESDERIRDFAVWGYFGGHLNCTDGRYVYMRASQNPEDKGLYEYTLMPTHMHSFFNLWELQHIEIQPAFGFTKGCQLMKTAAGPGQGNQCLFGSLLFDLAKDPHQLSPIKDAAAEAKMLLYMKRFMDENEAPKEQYARLGILRG